MTSLHRFLQAAKLARFIIFVKLITNLDGLPHGAALFDDEIAFVLFLKIEQLFFDSFQ